MFGIFDKLNDFIKDMLIGAISSDLKQMFTNLNTEVGEIAVEVGKTPQAWNSDIFNLIKTLSEDVVIPIAGLILTFVVCYELISMLIERNNMHDFDTWIFFKWIFKTCVAIYLLTHTFEIVMAIFDVAQNMVSSASGSIQAASAINIDTVITGIEATLETYEVGSLLGLFLEIKIIGVVTKILAALITVILYGRMIEIYIVSSVAPIPFATLTNREWGQIGTNYIKSMFALGIQGFFIMVCVGIYAILISTISISTDIHATVWGIFAYSILLIFSLFKTSSIAKSVLQAH